MIMSPLKINEILKDYFRRFMHILKAPLIMKKIKMKKKLKKRKKRKKKNISLMNMIQKAMKFMKMTIKMMMSNYDIIYMLLGNFFTFFVNR